MMKTKTAQHLEIAPVMLILFTFINATGYPLGSTKFYIKPFGVITQMALYFKSNTCTIKTGFESSSLSGNPSVSTFFRASALK
jgi:hypothetical protein